MRSSFLLAWRQLSFHRMKLAVAAAGVVVAVMLMLVQLGIREGAMENAVALTRRVAAQLVVISPRTKTIFQATSFPRRLLFRLPAHPGVARVQEAYLSQARWRNPWTYREQPISVYGIDPDEPLLKLPGYSERAEELRLRDHVIFDGLSRTSFGPVVETVKQQGWMETEVNLRRLRVVGTINVGISITTDGNLYMTPENFLRLFPERKAGAVDLGLIELQPGVDPQQMRKELQSYLGTEAIVLTQPELCQQEVTFLRDNAPIDFIFGMGAAVGFFIGFVVVYQILYTEVTNHLPQFATMKAIGFTDNYLLRVVLSQALILSVLGYIPGFLMALWLYGVATKAIQMQFSMTLSRAVMVGALTLIMCGLSAAVAVRKAQSADPADVF
ncbi:MAG: ABC transporter permease DevC [Planctomycetaceae bacterium]|nr:ABC transporter permease DevC [Planctomycetaceae bacterium]